MKRSLFLAVALAAALAGCASGVKLNDVPVEDKSGGAGGQAAAAAGNGGQTQVKPVEADTAQVSNAGPVNVARLIYFDYDSNAIKPEFQALIEQHARYLKENAKRHVVVEGHTDERGGSEYNLALGQRRAEAVRQALVLLGVKDNQVEAVSFGKEKPAVEGHDEAAWSKNRRAEIVYR